MYRMLSTLLPLIVVLVTGCNDIEDSNNSSSSISSNSHTSSSSQSSSFSSLPNGVISEFDDFFWKKSIVGTHDLSLNRSDGFLAPVNALIEMDKTELGQSISFDAWLDYAEAYGYKRNEWDWIKRNLTEVFWGVRDALLDNAISGEHQASLLFSENINITLELIYEDFLTGKVIYNVIADETIPSNLCPDEISTPCEATFKLDLDFIMTGGPPQGGMPAGRANLSFIGLQVDINQLIIKSGDLLLDLSNNRSAFTFSELQFLALYDPDSCCESFSNIPFRTPNVVLASGQEGSPSKINIRGSYSNQDVKFDAKIEGEFVNFLATDNSDQLQNSQLSPPFEGFLSGRISGAYLQTEFNLTPKE